MSCWAQLQENRLPALIERCEGLRWVHIWEQVSINFRSIWWMTNWSLAPAVLPQGYCRVGYGHAACHEKQLPDRWITEPPQAWYMADLGCLENKTLGIIGFGTIGQAIAKRALAFDMNIIAKVRTHRTSTTPGVELVEDLDSYCCPIRPPGTRAALYCAERRTHGYPVRWLP